MPSDADLTMPYLTVNRQKRGTFDVDVEGHRLLVEDRAAGTGHGAGPSPVELLVTSVATRAASCADAYLARHGYPAAGLQVTCHYRCSVAQPSVVSSIDVTICAPPGLPEDHRADLLRAASRCGAGTTAEVAVMLVVTEEVGAGQL
jgi:putative redox protein